MVMNCSNRGFIPENTNQATMFLIYRISSGILILQMSQDSSGKKGYAALTVYKNVAQYIPPNHLAPFYAKYCFAKKDVQQQSLLHCESNELEIVKINIVTSMALLRVFDYRCYGSYIYVTHWTTLSEVHIAMSTCNVLSLCTCTLRSRQ